MIVDLSPANTKMSRKRLSGGSEREMRSAPAHFLEEDFWLGTNFRFAWHPILNERNRLVTTTDFRFPRMSVARKSFGTISDIRSSLLVSASCLGNNDR